MTPPSANSPAVPFLALADDYACVREAVRARFERVLDSQVFVLGRETAELEAAIAAICGARHAVACASGTDAISLALLALGIGPGDAVIVPAFTFIATAGAVRRAGAVPVFADVGAETFAVGAAELDAVLGREFERRGAAAYAHRASGARLRALILVHLFGHAAATAPLRDKLADAEAVLIEDAAQAIGAANAEGPVGSRGVLGCLSFYPTKNLGGAGDGGAITTGDDKLAASLGRLRTHGAAPGEPLYPECGVNARLDELQAAYLNAKLPHLAEWTEARARVAAWYCEELAPLAARGLLEVPELSTPPAHVWHQFVVRIAANRDGVRKRLDARGIQTRVFYPVPLHLQPCFADLGYRAGSLPAAERLAARALSLPIYPSLSRDQAGAVCAALGAALGA